MTGSVRVSIAVASTRAFSSASERASKTSAHAPANAAPPATSFSSARAATTNAASGSRGVGRVSIITSARSRVRCSATCAWMAGSLLSMTPFNRHSPSRPPAVRSLSTRCRMPLARTMVRASAREARAMRARLGLDDAKRPLAKALMRDCRVAGSAAGASWHPGGRRWGAGPPPPQGQPPGGSWGGSGWASPPSGRRPCESATGEEGGGGRIASARDSSLNSSPPLLSPDSHQRVGTRGRNTGRLGSASRTSACGRSRSGRNCP